MASVTEIAREYFALKQKAKEYEELRKDCNNKADEVEFQLVKAMEESGVSSFKDSDLNVTFFQQVELGVKVEDKDQFISWIKENGMNDIITETINAKKRDSVIKEHIRNTGADVPGIKISPYTKINTRKSS